ncbi:MAG: NAD(P)-dependent oxidoreductase, partial [Pseudomonadota bacterium]
MKHFPIFVALEGRRVVLSGGGEAAVAKLRLILKTEAHVTVYAKEADEEIIDWANEGKLTLEQREMQPGDTAGAVLFYAADEDDEKDAHTSAIDILLLFGLYSTVVGAIPLLASEPADAHGYQDSQGFA